MDRYSSELKEFILKNCGGMTREAQGLLKYPDAVPSEPTCPFYSKALWDWDSWLVSIALGQVEQETGEQGRDPTDETGLHTEFPGPYEGRHHADLHHKRGNHGAQAARPRPLR